MLGKLNQVAIAVPDLDEAVRVYQDVLEAVVSDPEPQPDQGVTVVYVDLPNTRIELMAPLGDSSPIAGFLKRNPRGGVHHIGFEVEDLPGIRERLAESGVGIAGDGRPRSAASGNPVLFLHPKDFNGTLIELEEVEGAYDD